MSSCSSSSNIQGSSTIINPTGSQARLSMRLVNNSDGYTLDSNIFAGAIVRYQGGTFNQYTLSQADDNESAEVVGVVESKDGEGIEVIVRGLINYPAGATLNLIEDINGDDGGGSGGNDIWFLSAATAGEVQNLEPIEAGQIAKPIMQTVATDDNYNYQVLNYIGYAIGGEVAVDELNGTLPIGAASSIPEDSSIPADFIDASQANELEVSKYPDYYTKVGKKYGYVERLTLNTSSSVVPSLVNKTGSQKSGSSTLSTGKILRVDTVNNTVDIKKAPGEAETDTTKNVVLNTTTYTPTSASVLSVYTPRVTSNVNFTFFVDGKAVAEPLKVIYKVRNTGGASIPTKVTIKEMNVTDKLTAGNSAGSSFDDVVTEIINLKTRMTDLENKVNGT